MGYRAHADPPCTLGDRLQQLNSNLQALAIRLKDAIAGAISGTVGQAVRDVIRKLLGIKEVSRPQEDLFGDPAQRQSDGWEEDDWLEEQQAPVVPTIPE